VYGRGTAGAQQTHRRRCTARVAIVGGKGPAHITISTLNIRCIGELVFIPYTDNLVKIFPMGVGLYNEVRPYKIPVF
jgi:hypothetical protein